MYALLWKLCKINCSKININDNSRNINNYKNSNNDSNYYKIPFEITNSTVML